MATQDQVKVFFYLQLAKWMFEKCLGSSAAFYTTLHNTDFTCCHAESYEELYCFSYKPNTDERERQQEWELVDLQAEYNRMGLAGSQWKLSSVNQHYKVSLQTSVCGGCAFFLLVWSRYHFVLLSFFFFLFSKVSDTYPADLFVPESATPPVIVGSSKFRSRGRFPTLSYYCRETHVRPSHSLYSVLFW